MTNFSSKILPNARIKIKKIFKIIGAAEAAANLLCEFKIAEKNEARLTKSIKGNVTFVSCTGLLTFQFF